MKKLLCILALGILVVNITGCGKKNTMALEDEISNIQLLGDLVTLESYYHNVAKLDKEAGKGITHIFEKDRKLWIEYTGTVKLGVDMSKVTVKKKGSNQIEVTIPKAKIIGNADILDESFNEKSFIDSEDGFLIKNKLTADDSRDAMALAQEKMVENVNNNQQLLKTAQIRAKNLVEDIINQFNENADSKYDIKWVYES